MRPIPQKLRNELAQDPNMKFCVYEAPEAPNHNCSGHIEWEHAFIYSGKQINEVWAIIGCCIAHNRTSAMDKNYNKYRALLKAKSMGLWEQVLSKYPKVNWDQEYNYLKKKYGKERI